MTRGPITGGGNMNEVERDGDTVLRRTGAWTPTVHRYLHYLRQAGVEWVPRPLPSDAAGQRERLSFIEGDVPEYPLPGWVWSDQVLIDGARRLRQLHDASIGFGLDGAVWQSLSRIPAEVICHNDFAPHNLVFADGSIVGAIDFDFCSPGPRLWDVAYFATRIVPFTSAALASESAIAEARRRVILLSATYGEDHGGTEMNWSRVARMATIRLHELAVFSRAKARELRKPGLADDAAGYERDAGHLAALANH